MLTLGFTLDGQGRKMSKSLGNVIDPNEIFDTLGADIVRLWVASVDSTSDMACDRQILDRVSDAYRRFRNTFRFLLGELEGQFDLESDGLPVSELTALDRLALARLSEVHAQVEDAYGEYRFNQVYRLLYDYVVTELSNGYLNATKDRMYCDAPDAAARRSAQTAWYHILSMLLHDLQPILAYTCDEVMAYVPASMRDGKQFAALLSWYQAPMDAAEREQWLPAYRVLTDVRNAFTKAYEEAQTSGAVQEKTTQATRARVTLPGIALELLAPMAGDVAEYLVCSEVELVAGDELSVEVAPAHGDKCPRCWNWRELGEDGLCERCHEALDALEGDA